MPSNPPLSTLVMEIVRHTPSWVWGVLLLLIVLGARQLRDHTISRTRLLIAPIALGAYSLYGATSLFGLRPDVIAAWSIAGAAVVGINQWLRRPVDVRPAGDDGFALRGSVWPMATLLSVFALRYVATVNLVIHPTLAHDTPFSLSFAGAYGALSGVMLARAWRVLRGAAVPANDAPQGSAPHAVSV